MSRIAGADEEEENMLVKGIVMEDIEEELRAYSLKPNEPRQPEETKEMIELRINIILFFYF